MARNCPSCGRANDDDARFCSGCGAAIPSLCSSCGAALAADAAFCTACGAASGAAAMSATPAAAPAHTGPSGPPPAAPPREVAPGDGGPPRKGLSPALLIVVIVLVVVAAAAAAVFFFVLRGGSDDNGGTPTPTPVASTSISASPAPVQSFYLAAVTGPRANALSTVDPDGTVREITKKVGAQVFQLAWSQDGERLACVAGTWKRRTLWLADLAAGEVAQEQISTPAVVSVDSVAWLNPHQLLVAGFTTVPKNRGEVAELLVIDPDMHGDDAQPLEDGGGLALRGVSVSASQDGYKIAFVTYTDQKVNEYGMASATEKLELLDWQSGEVTELGSNDALFDVNARSFDEPLIAPTGDAIIFRSAGSDVGTSYTVLDAAGATLMPAKKLLYPAGYAWDPTGQKVVFTGHSTNWKGGSGDPTIFYVFDRAVGGSAKEITRYKKTAVQGLSWSPSGDKIAFSEWDQGTYATGKIYELSSSGGDASLLARDALFPAYQPEP
jgi:Tol biopolymer transport system component